MQLLEKLKLRYRDLAKIDGDLRLPPELFELFLQAPHDPLPEFEGPPKLRGGRGKDHPRYGRWTYSMARFFKPDLIVEVGSYAGGTGVGWGRAIHENGKGRLVCIDNDSYTSGTYPDTTRRNLLATGLKESDIDFQNGDSKVIIPQLAEQLKGQVDFFLVDADHTYEGALADITNGLPMLKSGGFLLVHDVEIERRMDEQTENHPHPVYEAFMEVVGEHKMEWCILKFIRKHLGIARIA